MSRELQLPADSEDHPAFVELRANYARTFQSLVGLYVLLALKRNEQGAVHDIEALSAAWPDSAAVARRRLSVLASVGLIERSGDWWTVPGLRRTPASSHAKAGSIGMHRRWHEARGVSSSHCRFCTESSTNITPSLSPDNDVVIETMPRFDHKHNTVVIEDDHGDNDVVIAPLSGSVPIHNTVVIGSRARDEEKLVVVAVSSSPNDLTATSHSSLRSLTRANGFHAEHTSDGDTPSEALDDVPPSVQDAPHADGPDSRSGDRAGLDPNPGRVAGSWPSPPVPLPPDPAVHDQCDDEPGPAEQLIAEWIAWCPRRPPSKVTTALGVRVADMLGEGIDPEHIACGLRLWQMNGKLGAGMLDSFVHQAMNAPTGTRRSTTDAKVAESLAMLAQMEARQAAGLPAFASGGILDFGAPPISRAALPAPKDRT